MSKIEESIYNSVGKYGISLNENLGNKKSINGIKRKLIEEVMGLDNSNKVVYVAKPGQGTVTSLIKQLGHCMVISSNNTDEMAVIGNSPVIFDGIERFDEDALSDAINMLRDAPNKVVVVTYDPIIGKALKDCGVKTINLRNNIKEEYSLVGQDGNAFSLMGYTARCMKECGLRDEIDEMRRRAMSSDYNNLIVVCDEYIQKCNEIAGDDVYECLSSDNAKKKNKKVQESLDDYNEYLPVDPNSATPFKDMLWLAVDELDMGDTIAYELIKEISEDDAEYACKMLELIY